MHIVPSFWCIRLAQDLDPALLSRFDASVTFGLPSEKCRRQILRQYARHLPEVAITQLAADAEGMSGRDLRDVAEQAERRWASKARSEICIKLRIMMSKMHDVAEQAEPRWASKARSEPCKILRSKMQSYADSMRVWHVLAWAAAAS